MNTNYRQQKKRFYKHPLFIAFAAVLLIILIVFGLELTNTTSLFHTRKANKTTTTATQATKGEITGGTNPSAPAINTDTTSGQPSSQTKTQPGDSKSNSDQNTTLIQPNGNFVSAHKNVPLDAALSSVCNTTPSASCQINFTANGITKSLVSQITDRGGAAYWNSWTPASIGLTAGSWQVEAVATMGGQTKTNTDALNLELH